MYNNQVRYIKNFTAVRYWACIVVEDTGALSAMNTECNNVI